MYVYLILPMLPTFWNGLSGPGVVTVSRGGGGCRDEHNVQFQGKFYFVCLHLELETCLYFSETSWETLVVIADSKGKG